MMLGIIKLESGSMAVVKIIELIGSSPKSWEDAAKNAFAEAAKTIKNINLSRLSVARQK
jgi:flavin-binding protein dodecin